MRYEPAPIDNSNIELSPELQELVEMLARNNHELWAKLRVSEGWTLGPVVDSQKKTTPLLIPYEALAESEKDYDRQNAVETLKTVLALGGSIWFGNATAQGNAASAAGTGLLEAWSARKPRQITLAEYRNLSGRANDSQEYLLACDIANEGLQNWPKDVVLRQLKAKALSHSGSAAQSLALLTGLRDEGFGTEETLGMLAGVTKEVWVRTGDPGDLKRAFQAYEAARDGQPERYWATVNMATLAFAMGDAETALKLAAEIERICALKIAQGDSDVYWLTATRAEAALIAENYGAAINFYRQAARIARDQPGHRLSKWRNASIILRYIDPKIADSVRKALDVPTVGFFQSESGRGRNYDEAVQRAIKKAISEKLLERNVATGYSSAAAGPGLLFAECLLEAKVAAHLVLPCKEEQFAEESLRPAGDDWVARFASVKARADLIFASAERLEIGDIGWKYSSDLLRGLAEMQALNTESELVRFEIAEVETVGCEDGDLLTTDEVDDSGRQLVRISVPRKAVSPPENPLLPRATQIKAETRAILFADAYHFSRLSEEQMPGFIRDFMGVVATAARAHNHGILYRNTWGDGLFFVFEKILYAGQFALELASRIARLDRKAAKLPEDLTLRIALHAGPVYQFKDDLTGRMNYIGSHVNRAARIEPVTAPGCVYVSDAFAALATLEAPGQFQFNYVGRIPLAKNFGQFPMYQMHSR